LTLEEFAEMTYIYKRWQLLDEKYDRVSDRVDFPEVEVALKEIADIMP
jgi:hypothetical protein